ncbi:SixA phosphatase family protein [Rhizobium tubonense]|uniref:Phosphohistidine phosphatase n=1 Tax=Rhizobium tubonense TaxID=484088 RepID=A0A2W4D758_9HYPH|nr:histidine phosphatase family protein [Rhizobium tubonense]PZM13124.1 phosphohistidine phosphatase [Rhizobium tubonense]
MTSISPPPFRIYLLRHAEAAAAQSGGRDFDRPLNDNGFAAAEIVADQAVDKGYRPELVISSTAARCRQTAEAVRRSLDPSVEFRFVDSLYNGTRETYLALLAAQTTVNSVMLVGHNPNILQTLEALIGHDALAKALPKGFPTAGLAVLEPIEDAGAASNGWLLADFVSE